MSLDEASAGPHGSATKKVLMRGGQGGKASRGADWGRRLMPRTEAVEVAAGNEILMGASGAEAEAVALPAAAARTTHIKEGTIQGARGARWTAPLLWMNCCWEAAAVQACFTILRAMAAGVATRAARWSSLRLRLSTMGTYSQTERMDTQDVQHARLAEVEAAAAQS